MSKGEILEIKPPITNSSPKKLEILPGVLGIYPNKFELLKNSYMPSNINILINTIKAHTKCVLKISYL